MNSRDNEPIGCVRRNLYADLAVAVARHRGRIYITLETVSAETGQPFDSGRPRILSLQPETVRDLIPLLSEAFELAARMGGRS